MSINILVTPLLLAYVCNILSNNSIDTGFPQFWSIKIQIIALILSVIMLVLPWAFKVWVKHEAKKRNDIDQETYNSIILITGLSLTTIPSLIGFLLFIGGGEIRTTYLFSAASFVVGIIWLFFSFGTYFKKAC